MTKRAFVGILIISLAQAEIAECKFSKMESCETSTHIEQGNYFGGYPIPTNQIASGIGTVTVSGTTTTF